MKKNYGAKIAKNVALGFVSLLTIVGCSNNEISHFIETQGKPELIHMTAMTDEKNGIAVGFSGLVLYTEDGGTTWTEVERKSACLFAMDWLSAKECVSGGNKGGLVRTEDGGRNWIRYPEIPIVRIKDVSFKSFDKGWISSKSDIFETLDQGQTWTKIENPTGIRGVETIYMIDQGSGYMCSHEGVFYKTTDGGASWSEVTKVFDKNDESFKVKTFDGMCQVTMAFKDGIGHIECIGTTSKGSALKTFKSLDNGATWKEVDTTQLEKLPVTVNVYMSDLISLTNSDLTTSVYKISK